MPYLSSACGNKNSFNKCKINATKSWRFKIDCIDVTSRFRATKCRTRQKTTKCGANCAKVRFSHTNWNFSWLDARKNWSTCADWIRSNQKLTAHLSAIKREALAMTSLALENLNSEPPPVRKLLSKVVEIESLIMSRVSRIQRLSQIYSSPMLEIL